MDSKIPYSHIPPGNILGGLWTRNMVINIPPSGGLLDWPTLTKTYLINLGARNLVFYIKIMNSVALFLGDTLEKSLRLQGHYFPYLRLFWHRR